MKLIYGYSATSTSTQHDGKTITLPTSFTTTKYQIVCGLNTNNNGGNVQFYDFGYVSKTKANFVYRMSTSTYYSGVSYLCIGS